MIKYFDIKIRKFKRNGEKLDFLWLGDGHVAIEDGKIVGYIAFDYIEGYIKDKESTIKINFSDKSVPLILDITEEIFLPNTFKIKGKEFYIEIEIANCIRNLQEKIQIEKAIAMAKAYSVS